MPELPEVETIRRQLRGVLLEKRVESIKILNDKSFIGEVDDLLGLKITDISRSAKIIEVVFAGGVSVNIHLKMTGQLIYVDVETRVAGGHPTSDWINNLPSKHTRVIWTFNDNTKLFFNDLRKFGWMRIIQKSQEPENCKKQVPDVVDKEFTKEYLEEILGRQKRIIKVVILDQKLMGGIGNIYACDALFLAGIHPERKANTLSSAEIKRLHGSIVKVINLGIEMGGASAANYVDTNGKGGRYQNHFLVYKREDEPCKSCKNKIYKAKLAGRGTYYCKVCQK